MGLFNRHDHRRVKPEDQRTKRVLDKIDLIAAHLDYASAEFDLAVDRFDKAVDRYSTAAACGEVEP